MSSPAETIDLDDLTSPRLTDVQRQVLEYTESRLVTFDIDRMIEEAIAGAGSDDLGYTTDFAARLDAHVAAVEADTGLTQHIALTDCSAASQSDFAGRSD